MAAGDKELLIIGPGVLGSLVGGEWLKARVLLVSLLRLLGIYLS